MKHQKDLLDELYQTALSNFGNKEFSFEDLLSAVSKQYSYTNEYLSKILGSLYADLLLDQRFVNIGDNKWTLKENLSFEDYKNKINDMYQFCSANVTEEVDEQEALVIEEMNQLDKEEESDNLYSDSYDSDDEISSDSRNISNVEVELEDEEDDDDKDIILEK